MKLDVVKKASSSCNIVFNPALLICKKCDPDRFRFCSLYKGLDGGDLLNGNEKR